MSDKSKFTEEEWIERDLRKTISSLVNHPERQKKLRERDKQKEAHLKKIEGDILVVQQFKRDENGNIKIPLEGGDFLEKHFETGEKLEFYKTDQVNALHSKKDYEQFDYNTIQEKKRVLIELKLEGKQYEKDFYSSINFDNQREKLGYTLHDTKTKFNNFKKNKVSSINSEMSKFKKEFKNLTNKTYSPEFGLKVKGLMREHG